MKIILILKTKLFYKNEKKRVFISKRAPLTDKFINQNLTPFIIYTVIIQWEE